MMKKEYTRSIIFLTCLFFTINALSNRSYERKQGLYKVIADLESSLDKIDNEAPMSLSPHDEHSEIPQAEINGKKPDILDTTQSRNNTILNQKKETTTNAHEDKNLISSQEDDQQINAESLITTEQINKDQNNKLKQNNNIKQEASDSINNSIPPALQNLELRKEATPEEKHIPKNNENDDEEIIEFNFENADLQNLITQVSELYNVTFITDENINPIPTGGKAIKGYKISFKTHKPLSKKEAWNLFITFLDLAGFSLIPEADPSFYRIAAIPTAKKSPVPVYIGIDPDNLPDNDQIIRYIYFIENSTIETIKTIVDSLRSSVSSLAVLQEIKAFILTDKAYNIKILMKIVKELDKVSMPQAMSVLKLTRADAQEAKKLYDTLTQIDDKSITARLFPARRQPTSLYFPENTRVIAEPRTNSLILLGPQDAIQKIEDFMRQYIDSDPEKPFSPLHIYELKYADAITIANIMNNVSQFGKETAAGKSGGVRGGDKYLKPMTFIAEPTTNSIIVRGDFEDFLTAKEVISQLDEAQPQLAIEILILSITINDSKALGAQLRSKEPNGIDGLVGKNVEFQTSGFLGHGIQERSDATTGSYRLLADLVNLAKGAAAGNTILTLGSDMFGVWGIFRALQTVSNTQIISNPFLVATNKTKAKVSIGRTIRVVTSTIIATGETPTYGDEDAKLEVEITPQINSDGMIVLELKVSIVNFVQGTTETSVAKTIKEITTKTIVADKEILALGGLIQNKTNDNMSKTPILGDIPLLGWLFKNKEKDQTKDNLLILISTQIIEPQTGELIGRFTQERINDYYRTMGEMHDISEPKDPIYRAFFAEKKGSTEQIMNDFLITKKSTKKSKADTKKVAKRTKRRSRKERPTTRVVHNKSNDNSINVQHDGGIKI